MNYTIYQITNQVNGKRYIGAHKTRDLDDDYMGSGKLLIRAIEKYGIENFTKEILFVFNTSKEMFDKERELVNEEFVASKDTYNLKLGGFGGFEYINNNRLGGKSVLSKESQEKGRRSQSLLNKTDRNYKEKKAENIRQGIIRNWGSYKGSPSAKSFLGRKHTEKSKAIMGKKSSLHNTGEGNPHYGTIWIKNPHTRECGRIKKENLQLWEQKGWTPGKYQKDAIYVKL